MRKFIAYYKDLVHTARQNKRIFRTLILPFSLAFCASLFLLNGIFIAALGTKAQTVSDISILQKGIAEQILRLHVIANSDSKEDQAAKLIVKDNIVSYMTTFLTDCDSKEESMNQINEHLPQIIAKAKSTLKDLGYTYEVSASLGKAEFPIKVYGDITLPAGEYDALRIQLGNAQGKNWWCIVYPNLCYVDSTYQVVPEDSKLKLRFLLSEEEFRAISEDETYDEITNEEEPEIVVKFKLWEWLKDLFS